MIANFTTFCHILGLNHRENIILESKYMFFAASLFAHHLTPSRLPLRPLYFYSLLRMGKNRKLNQGAWGKIIFRKVDAGDKKTQFLHKFLGKLIRAGTIFFLKGFDGDENN